MGVASKVERGLVQNILTKSHRQFQLGGTATICSLLECQMRPMIYISKKVKLASLSVLQLTFLSVIFVSVSLAIFP